MSETALHGKSADPYRIFFPLGMVMGIAGVSIWPLYFWGVLDWYNGRSHAYIQTDCFIYAFIVGFLWTAIPRFTGTEVPPRWIQYIVMGLILIQAFAFEHRSFALGHVLFIVSHLIVISVAVRCFLRRKNPPPETFVLVGLGMLAGLVASVVNAGISLEWITPDLDLMGRRLMSEGMILLLVLGVGGFLGTRLLGFAQLPNFQNIGAVAGNAKSLRAIGRRKLLYALAGFSILASIVLEYAWNLAVFGWIRAAVITALVLVNIQPWRKPATRTTLAWCVWIAHWLLIAGAWIIVVLPKYRIDMLHVMFMGAFTLLVLAVGTRVVLSHGGHSLAQEKRSWPLRIGLTTGLVAMLARMGAPFATESYFDHLAWAAVLWISGIFFWGIFILRRVMKGGQ